MKNLYGDQHIEVAMILFELGMIYTIENGKEDNLIKAE